MTILTLRAKDLVGQEVPYECASCPFSESHENGLYRCALSRKTVATKNHNPACLGSRVTVKGREGIGEIAVVRVLNGLVRFLVSMDDGSLANVACEECELANVTR